MAKKKQAEAPENAERWLLTYADVVTLLLALFIFLYSISEINSAKLAAFSASMATTFGIRRIPQPGSGTVGGDGLLPKSNSIVRLQNLIQFELRQAIENDEMSMEINEEGLIFRFKDKVLFGSGSADLNSSVTPILMSLARNLKKLPNHIRVEGHTDNVPIVNSSRYASNWDLSGARAASVLRFLVERGGLDPSRLSLAGYAEYRPRVRNRGEVGNPENRRVEIMIIENVNKVDLSEPAPAIPSGQPQSYGIDELEAANEPPDHGGSHDVK